MSGESGGRFTYPYSEIQPRFYMTVENKRTSLYQNFLWSMIKLTISFHDLMKDRTQPSPVSVYIFRTHCGVPLQHTGLDVNLAHLWCFLTKKIGFGEKINWKLSQVQFEKTFLMKIVDLDEFCWKWCPHIFFAHKRTSSGSSICCYNWLSPDTSWGNTLATLL